ncbi:PREDICTED: 26S proteasome non-ATPase regulatory subunit 2-like [Polistes dominula]|uniref:26S proteasome non-ATPase regulatory subunit 2 n=1 Tax=Polistes dominula TaxID=743375 RepID=A0ABM1J7U8_POLDO|nr:PREDICTED: 26S proteasome non-ATPase regulatory subunit 2-like [Polistes dominula]
MATTTSRKDKKDEMGKDENAMIRALIHLRILIQTSTTSMTSVPKPLKYLREYYPRLKDVYNKIKGNDLKKQLAEILSVLVIAETTSTIGKRECLEFCLKGSVQNPGEWGHEYVRQLEAEIVDEWTSAPIKEEKNIRLRLTPLIKSIVQFNMKHNAEIQACDLCLEIDQIHFLLDHLNNNNFLRVLHYLTSCAAYSEEMEKQQILEFVYSQYIRFNDYSKAMLIAIQLNNPELVFTCLNTCIDPLIRKQLAFLIARQQNHLQIEKYEGCDADEIKNILTNGHVNGHFQILTRELDILEPKLPEDIYKTWLETGTRRNIDYDSVRSNLAASFVTAFVHAGFGEDKLMSNTKDCWVYKNKGHAMLSATASLGLIHLWDVDGGLVPIDKYLYTNDDYIKSGALLAIGLVNCGVKNECDPALALLSDYVLSDNLILRIGAILGLSLAYAGSQRSVLAELFTSSLNDKRSTMEIVGLSALGLGLVYVGTANSNISSTILQKLLELTLEEFANTHYRFISLALGILYMGCRDVIDTPSAALEVLPEPYRLACQTMLQICAYAGTGDVLIVQELLRICSEPVNGKDDSIYGTPITTPVVSCCDHGKRMGSNQSADDTQTKNKTPNSREIGISQAIASLGVGVVGLGEGKENSRIFGQVGRYGPTQARRAVPLAMALSSLSNPEPALLDVLNKYSHDNDVDVAHNAILALGLVGAGSNNARLATMLRQLAAYHAKNPSHLFLVRISQGLVHLGKGTLSLSPMHYASRILDQTALAGLMVVLVACLDCRNLILDKSHYLMYCLATAMEPRWLVTLDTNLKILPVSVRVGQAVDIVGKAGNPKSIAGGNVHTTPTLLTHNERAELLLDEYEPLSSVLEGFVILREKTDG